MGNVLVVTEKTSELLYEKPLIKTASVVFSMNAFGKFQPVANGPAVEKLGKLFQPSFEKSGDTFFVFFLSDIVDVGMVRAVDQI